MTTGVSTRTTRPKRSAIRATCGSCRLQGIFIKATVIASQRVARMRARYTSGTCSRRREVICPSGIFVSSPLCKNISLHPSGKSSLQTRAIPPHQRGVGHRHERGEGCGGRGSVLRATGLQGGLRSVSDQQHADERCCCVRRSRVVLTPRRWRQVRGVASAQPGLDKTYPLTTVANKPGHRGEHEGNVCRGKARFLRGCKSLPARVAPAGSNRSRREGNDLSEAFDGKGR